MHFYLAVCTPQRSGLFREKIIFTKQSVTCPFNKVFSVTRAH